MNYEAVINPCSSIPAVSPQTESFSSGKFPPRATMPPQDPMSHFQDLRQQTQLLQLPSQQPLAPPPQQWQQQQLRYNRQLAESILPLEQRMDQLRINQTVYLQPQQPQQQQQQQQQYNQPSIQQSKQVPPSNSLEPSTQQLVSTPVKEKLSRRWPLASRFFEKRKNVTVPPHIPNSQTLTTDDKVISFSVTDLSTSMPQQPAQPTYDQNENPISPTDSDAASVPESESNSQNSSRRGSMADIPKAFLSSFRRASLSSNSISSNSDKKSNVNDDIAEEDNEDHGVDEYQIESGKNETPTMTAILCADGLRQVNMAVPKGPPTRAAAPPHKSILKKQPYPNPSSRFSPRPGYNASSNRLPENMYPIAPSGKDVDISLLTHSPDPNQEYTLSPPWGREMNAFITTKPSLISPKALDWLSASPLSREDRSKLDNDRSMFHRAATPPDLDPGLQSSNCQGRGGERSQGQLMDLHLGGRDTTRYFRVSPRSLQQQSMTMGAHISHLAQDLSVQYHDSRDSGPFVQQPSSWPSSQVQQQQQQYQPMHQQTLLTPRRFQYHGSRKRQNSMNEPMAGLQNSISMRVRDQDVGGCISISSLNARVDNGDSDSVESECNVPGEYGFMNDNEDSGGGRCRKTLSFMDTIEIIPAHRKSEYNRRSDKDATFRILTPDLKTEIRDELNTFKMSEMTVHVESMKYTTFH
ncbi:hypothetical protein BG011_008911 [Mortierella polycephala]|uniref:Uncharacterized protein n=1 Tax=Mortierella polycephala TaxID=41804 RepID=A0A9P6PP92_9FUNG|nr:hypothetical protein BG011_008911 [Mortierella polycephala]